MSNSTKIEFKAEIKKLLHILSQSLYQHKEIFLRELISNASDALKKFHFVYLENKDVEGPDLPLEIEVICNAIDNTILVRDTGVGMTKEELIDNLGTIAGSGTEKFLQSLMETQEDQAKEMDLDIIGRFGVGFYSVFMIADKVQVVSKSYLKDEPAYAWESAGDTEFTIEPAEKDQRGTDVVIHLKDEEKEFLSKWKLESIIKKYSNFVPYPIYVTEIKPPKEIAEGAETTEEEKEGTEEEDAELSPEDGMGEGAGDAGDITTAAVPERKPVNEILPLWKRPAAEITDEEYKNFYHFISKRYDNYSHLVNYRVDGQVQFSSIYFIPETRSRDLMQPDQDYGLALYSRNVMIIPQCKDVVPPWMRFISGVVESEDIPLNVSRDTIQSNRLILKIKDLLSIKLISELKSIADTDAAKYLALWNEFGIFIKEGIVTDMAHRDELLPLLRFKSSIGVSDELRSLDEYVQSAQQAHPDQKEIFYLVGENLPVMKISAHMGYYRNNDIEVVLFTEPIDNFLMMNVHDYKTTVGEGDAAEEVTFTFTAIDSSAEAGKSTEKPATAEGAEGAAEGEVTEPAGVPVSEEAKKFLELVKNVLGTKITDAVASDRLYDSPCRLAMPPGMTSSMERAMRFWTQNTGGKEFQVPRKIFEFNTNHSMIQGLIQLYAEDPLNGKIKPIVQQLFANCLLAEGDLPDPAAMVPRVNQLLEMLVTGSTDVVNLVEDAEESAEPAHKGSPVDFGSDDEEENLESAAAPDEPQDEPASKPAKKSGKKQKAKKQGKKSKK